MAKIIIGEYAQNSYIMISKYYSLRKVKKKTYFFHIFIPKINCFTSL